MFRSKNIKSLLLTVSALILSTSANAALVPRLDGQAVYDADSNVTWIADASLSSTNSFGVSGIFSSGYMNWDTAQNWILAMNAENYLGFSDWRLPTSLQPSDSACSSQNESSSSGAYCTGSEMGHLFYDELGGVVNNTISTTHNENYELFQNIKSIYWTGTEYIGNPEVYTWSFNFDDGFQKIRGNTNTSYSYVWAVRDGDVFVPPRCDLNNNGKVDAGDLSQVMRMIMADIAIDLDCDLNNGGLGDGVISVADLVIVSRIALGIIPAIYN